MKYLMVMFCDESGIARAWSYGPENLLEDIKAEAERQLRLYLSRKLIEGIPAPNVYCEFEMKIEEMV